jgi:hypothetical protein
LPAEPTVVDATVLRGFALADRMHHLAATLGGPAAVCRAVWHPDEEPGWCGQGRSELTRSITVQECRAQDDRRSGQDRAVAQRISQQLTTVRLLRDAGDLFIVDLDGAEEQLYARLVSTSQASMFQLAFPLAPSAAASVAVAATRAWRLASDDEDAHKALRGCAAKRRAVTTSELLVTELART